MYGVKPNAKLFSNQKSTYNGNEIDPVPFNMAVIDEHPYTHKHEELKMSILNSDSKKHILAQKQFTIRKKKTTKISVQPPNVFSEDESPTTIGKRPSMVSNSRLETRDLGEHIISSHKDNREFGNSSALEHESGHKLRLKNVQNSYKGRSNLLGSQPHSDLFSQKKSREAQNIQKLKTSKFQIVSKIGSGIIDGSYNTDLPPCEIFSPVK